MKRLLLLGGGHANVEVLRQFGLKRVPGLDVTLVNPERYAAYSGMLPGLIAGHYHFHECHIDLARLAEFAGAKFLNTSFLGMDGERHLVTLAAGPTIGYDIAAINVGAAPALPMVSGGTDNVIAAKPAEMLLHAWNTLVKRACARSISRIVVVGGGAAAIELLLAMQYRLRQLTGASAARFALVTDAGRLLPGHHARVAAIFQNLLASHHVEIVFNNKIKYLEAGAAIADDGTRIEADAFVWATGVAAVPHLQLAGFTRGEGGFIAINQFLQAPGYPDVYAAGDCAFMPGHSYPKSGVYAVRQGAHLARNLRRALDGKPPLPYHPQRRALALISSGGKHAVASYGALAVSGDWVWRWKHRIDHGFVAKYNTSCVK